MRHRVGIPPLGQHRDRDDATNLFAEPILLTDSVHDLAQERRIIDFAAGAQIARVLAAALQNIATKPLDLVSGHLAKILVERFAGFELRRIDQDRVGAGEPIPVLIVVTEEGKAAVFQGGRSVVILAVEAGDVPEMYL